MNDDHARIGMIVRADDGGLGAQTYEIWRHVRPYRTVVMDLSRLIHIPTRFDRYPQDRKFVSLGAWQADEQLLREFVDGLDVIYTAETPYNWRLFEICREYGVRSILHGNYEFLDFYNEPGLPPPDELWMASLWNYDHIPYTSWGIKTMRYVPTPIARDRCRWQPPYPRKTAATFLHIAGQETIADRNGTTAVAQVMPHLKSDAKVIILTQRDLDIPPVHNLEIRHVHKENYWELYEEGDVLLLPRKYGGQSLQLQEALSVGLPVISTDVEPQRGFLPADWLIPTRWAGSFWAKTNVDVYEPDVLRMAEKIDWFTEQRLWKHSFEANRIAETLSWDRWTDTYLDLFDEVASVV